MCFRRWPAALAGTLFSIAMIGSIGHADQVISPDEQKFFESKIRPVLIRECYGCHSNQSGNARGGLRLDTKELSAIGGSSGPAIVPGDLVESLLYNAITHEDFVMPPKRKLPDDVIEDFREWIEMGAPDPRVNQTTEIQTTISEEDIHTARENFWAYQHPQTPATPTVGDSAWPIGEVDHFILARLEQSSLTPTSDADAATVLRRLCFDLNGLPPNPEQIRSFASMWDKDADSAVAFVVDRLLQKDQFGERWGRHWLDVVRYGESTGREVNMTYPHAWRYRDYVIDSFNADKPFDEFVQEQIAGDLLPAKTDAEWAEHLIATSFLAMGPKNVNEQNRVQFRADLIDEQIDVTTRVFMGMSVACARCHDHKFDAIPQDDYYALAGVFGNMDTFYGNPPSEYGSFSSAQTKRNSSLLLLPVDDPNPFDKRYSASELTDLRRQMTDKMQETVESRRSQASGGNSADAVRQRLRRQNELTALSAKLAVIDENGQPKSYCMGVQERGTPTDARVLIRGEIDQRGQSVARGFPQVLCETPVSIDDQDSGRLELARWIGGEENPLTARVMVNRIWQHLMGQALVTSTENFGVTGQLPSHPELLDYLATQFIDSGWSVKALVREIAVSRAYRMKSTFDDANHEFDPDNKLRWRANPRRLDAEGIRDAMLAVSGELDVDRPRASVVAQAGYVRVRDGSLKDPREAVRDAARRAFQSNQGSPYRSQRPGAGGGRPGTSRFGRRPNTNRPGGNRSDGDGDRRTAESSFQEAIRKSQNQLDMEDANFRSVYLPIVRDEVPRSLEVFDFADSSAISGTRESSQTANQALFMMNNPMVIRLSDSFASRIAETGNRLDEQVDRAFVLAFGRTPTADERRASIRFLMTSRRQSGDNHEALSVFCQSLFASAEFRFVD